MSIDLRRNGQSALSVKLGQMEDDHRKLDTQRTANLVALKADVLTAVTRLVEEQKLSHNSVVSHLEDLHAVHDRSEKDIAVFSQRMLDLHSALALFAEKAIKTSVEQTVIRSLHFPLIHERYDHVKEAHPDTAHWVFDTKFSGGPFPDKTLHEWLESDHGICWLAGKPGSGKTTLMKRIWTEERMRESLQRWADISGHKLFIAGYFFWYAGSSLQKSQVGLLRAILYEVFRQCPDFVHLACNERRLDLARLDEDESPSWPLPELFHIIQNLAIRADQEAKFCFFVDGLDEYQVPSEGSHADLVQLFEQFRDYPNLKICASSREENSFRNIYTKCYHFNLQELNAEDIRI